MVLRYLYTPEDGGVEEKTVHRDPLQLLRWHCCQAPGPDDCQLEEGGQQPQAGKQAEDPRGRLTSSGQQVAAIPGTYRR